MTRKEGHFMSVIRKIVVQQLTVRPMERRDLRRVLQIEKETPDPLWTLQAFKADLDSEDRICLVGTFKGVVVGFMIARSVTEIETPETVPGVTGGNLTSTLPRRALHLNLLHVAVASDWLRRGVGSTLIWHLDKHVHRAEDRIHAVVPETNLPVQLLLRSAGYRATRVLRAFYGTEDAYQMERRPCS
jgi:ribosomal protein S18 acetylase RimI-like enzyme